MRVEMRTEISRLHRRLHCTMIYVTHDQVEAMTMADRIVVMHQGKVQQIASPQEIYQRPANLFVAGFIGSPPMNFLHGSLVEGRTELEFHEAPGQGPLPPIRWELSGPLSGSLSAYRNREIVLGIRPEHLEESETNSGFSALMDVVEPMGAETYLYLRTSRHSLVVRSRRPEEKRAEGKTHRFAIDLKQARFFDPHSGIALSTP